MKATVTAILLCLGLAVVLREARAQGPADPAATPAATLPTANPGDQVILKRELPSIIPASQYRVALVLDPYAQITLVAPFDGFVRQVPAKAGQKLPIQSEVVRLDNTITKLQLERAKAYFRAATAESKLAAGKDETTVTLAQARLEASKVELDIAQYQNEQSTVRVPFAAEILRVFVSEGQYVRAGEPLAVAGETSRMKVEIPVDRSATDASKPYNIKVDGTSVDARVESIVPLDTKFNPLRDLFDSVASAVLVLDNPEGKFRPGQTVFAPMMPRLPVLEVPNKAVGTLADGGRKIQVLRNFAVRDVPVTVLGPIGGTRIFVSGSMLPGDEVIYESSHQMNDGFQLRPSAAPAGAAAATPAATGSNPNF